MSASQSSSCAKTAGNKTQKGEGGGGNPTIGTTPPYETMSEQEFFMFKEAHHAVVDVDVGRAAELARGGRLQRGAAGAQRVVEGALRRLRSSFVERGAKREARLLRAEFSSASPQGRCA